MKKVLILFLLVIPVVTKPYENNISKTLYGVAGLSWIKALMNFPIGIRFFTFTNSGYPSTDRFLKEMWPKLCTAKGTGWAFLGVLCYNMAHRAT